MHSSDQLCLRRIALRHAGGVGAHSANSAGVVKGTPRVEYGLLWPLLLVKPAEGPA